MFVQITTTLIILILFEPPISFGFSFDTDCPSYCVCNYYETRMILACNNSQLNSLFRVPNPQQNPSIANTTSFVGVRSHLRHFPLNLCEYAPTLLRVDLSQNSIVENLNPSHFGCLTNLRVLNLSRNSISFVDANTFNSMLALEVLDLSYNRLTMIPTYLFYLKVPNLNSLFLGYNEFTEIDLWMLWMSNVRLIDLSHNRIVKFVNRIGWNPYYVSSNVKMSDNSLVDLSYNSIQSFDDSLLSMFSVCTANEFKYFFDIFKQFRLTNNPIECSCQSSYNLLKFYQAYASENLIPANFHNDRLVSTRCHSPATYSGHSIVAFVNPVICEPTSVPFTISNCGYLATKQQQQNNGTRKKDLFVDVDTITQIANASSVSSSLYTSQLVALFGAAVSFFFIVLILIYCVCPIEILAIFFNVVPYFNSVCPCKKSHKQNAMLDQDNDLFISYNKSNERWVKSKLVPFIKDNSLVDTYLLHYGSENRNKELFGPYVKGAMSRSACVLFVVSEQFLTHEWTSLEFRQHLRHLISTNVTRFVCVQMHDVLSEQITEYFTNELRLPKLNVLENDEFMFWAKLAYFLFTNQPNDVKVVAPKIHVKPQTNKVHSTRTVKKETPTTKKESQIFEVTQTYRSSLPPLRVSKRIDEETVMNNRPQSSKKFLLEEIEPSSVSIVRHSYHEGMRVMSSMSPSSQQTIHVESERKRASVKRDDNKYDGGSTKKRAEETTTTTKKNRARNVSFDIYDNLPPHNQRNKADDLYLYENSDFV